jgi:hypothetical protein
LEGLPLQRFQTMTQKRWREYGRMILWLPISLKNRQAVGLRVIVAGTENVVWGGKMLNAGKNRTFLIHRRLDEIRRPLYEVAPQATIATQQSPRIAEPRT